MNLERVDIITWVGVIVLVSIMFFSQLITLFEGVLLLMLNNIWLSIVAKK